MTQEDKELLLKDLCARLPYGVKVLVDNKCWCDFNGRTPSKITFDNCYRLLFLGTKLGYVKPYLFPLSSMTEEQKEELRQMNAFVNAFGQICFFTYDDYGHELMPTFEDVIRITNWLNKGHWDYRGLIEKGLAIDATGLNIY